MQPQHCSLTCAATKLGSVCVARCWSLDLLGYFETLCPQGLYLIERDNELAMTDKQVKIWKYKTWSFLCYTFLWLGMMWRESTETSVMI